MTGIAFTNTRAAKATMHWKTCCAWATGRISASLAMVTSHTAMILLAILPVLLSFAADTASQNATGTASLTTMVRRSGPVADLSVPLVALDPNSQYSLLYSLTSLTGLGRDARVEVEVRQ